MLAQASTKLRQIHMYIHIGCAASVLSFSCVVQVLTFASWAINTAAIFCGGRLDGGAKGVETAEDEDSKDVALPVVRYFMPAGWAFAIWGPIILGERRQVRWPSYCRRRSQYDSSRAHDCERSHRVQQSDSNTCEIV